MTFDPLKRDSSWQMVQPGCWLDPEGGAHLFPDEIVAFLQKEHPEAGFNFGREDYDLIVEVFKRDLLAINPNMRFTTCKHERESQA